MHPIIKLRFISHNRLRIYHPKVYNNVRYFQCATLKAWKLIRKFERILINYK